MLKIPHTIEIKVIPGAKKNRLDEIESGIKVYLTAPPVDGKANVALCQFLAKHYHVKKSQIEIIKGLKSRHKTVKILPLI